MIRFERMAAMIWSMGALETTRLQLQVWRRFISAWVMATTRSQAMISRLCLRRGLHRAMLTCFGIQTGESYWNSMVRGSASTLIAEAMARMLSGSLTVQSGIG